MSPPINSGILILKLYQETPAQALWTSPPLIRQRGRTQNHCPSARSSTTSRRLTTMLLMRCLSDLLLKEIDIYALLFCLTVIFNAAVILPTRTRHLYLLYKLHLHIRHPSLVVIEETLDPDAVRLATDLCDFCREQYLHS